jgi:type I restriction enzyme S subunit
MKQTVKNWRKVKLGDIADINMGQSPQSKFYNSEGDGLPFMQGVTEFGELFPTTKQWTSKTTKIANAGDILFSVRAPVGRINYSKEKLCIGRGLSAMKAREQLLSQSFLFYLLKNEQNNFISQSGGSIYDSINKDKLNEFEVKIPGIQTQKQIAYVLSAYDDLIENNIRRIKILEQMAQAIYAGSFNYSNQGGKDVSLDSVITICRGKSYSSEELSDDKGIPFVNLKCIDRDGGFRKSGLKMFTGKYKDTQKVMARDIVVAVTDMTQDRRIVARAARVPSLDGGFGVISMDLVKIQPKDGNDPDYIYALLRWSGFADEVKNHANGANVLHLIPDRISDYKTQIAPADQQAEFGKKVRPIFDLIDKLELQNENLRQTRDLLLPKLVTGEIRV